MCKLQHDFDNNFSPHTLFGSEELVRLNWQQLRGYIYYRIDKKNLPLSRKALTFYLSLIEQRDKTLRKDKSTRREQHEESHFFTIDKLLDLTHHSWIDNEKYGSEDALFAALILHDIVEDFRVPYFELEKMLLRDFTNGDLTKQRLFDIQQILLIVKCLSRKDENGIEILDRDRVQQARLALDHPYAAIIKFVDWCNKLQTMIGVMHFEQARAQRMGIVNSETSLIFVDEQQGLANQAIRKHPSIEEPIKIMDAILNCLFQPVNTYQKLLARDLVFDPSKAEPLHLDDSISIAEPLIERLPPGLNYFGPLAERLDIAGHNLFLGDELRMRVESYFIYMVQPAFFNIGKHIPKIEPPVFLRR